MIEVDELNLSVTNSPFTEGQATQINELLQTLTPEQKYGYGYLVANQQLTSGTSDTQGSQIGAVSKDTETMLQQNEPTIQPENERLHYYMVQKQEMRKV